MHLSRVLHPCCGPPPVEKRQTLCCVVACPLSDKRRQDACLVDWKEQGPSFGLAITLQPALYNS